VLSVNYPLFNCVSKTLLKGIFRGTIKNGVWGFFGRGGVKDIEVIISK
jgi:hypothetical protein